MHHSLAATLLPEYRRKVLGLLLLRPDLALHGREIARRTGLPAGSVTRELTRLAEVGLLKREPRGNQMLYSADTTCPVYTELAGILRKTSGVVDILVQALMPVLPALRVAFVFGSVAQGRETAGSDIDVMLVGDIGFAQAVELLHPTQSMLGREVNPKVFTEADFATALASQAFLRDVLAKPKLFLTGSEDELGKLGGHQP